jgi:hypothetical protein
MTTFSTPFEYESVPAFASLFFLFFSSVTKIRKLCDQLVRLYSNLRKTAAPSYLAFLPSEIFQEVCFFPHFFSLSYTSVKYLQLLRFVAGHRWAQGIGSLELVHSLSGHNNTVKYVSFFRLSLPYVCIDRWHGLLTPYSPPVPMTGASVPMGLSFGDCLSYFFSQVCGRWAKLLQYVILTDIRKAPGSCTARAHPLCIRYRRMAPSVVGQSKRGTVQ